MDIQYDIIRLDPKETLTRTGQKVDNLKMSFIRILNAYVLVV